jgi:serine/threonine-protein kinase
LAVVIPRSDLLGGVVVARNFAALGTLALGALIGAGILVAGMRKIRQQMKSALDRIEQKLGQYQIENKIGEGGNGTVFRARHALLRRPTALKLMHPAFASSDAARTRFEHEVRLTSALSHPNTIAIYDFGRTPDGTLYYAMELLEGMTLDRIVQIGGALPAGRVIHLLEQACGSLAEAHSKGLIHRDIKPSNLIACERGGLVDVLKVVDFGLVKEMAEADGNLTQANVLIGTPFFMAPETIRSAGAASPRSDLYALGAVAYYLLTGRHVFEGASAVEICAAHLSQQPVPPSAMSSVAVSADLESLILRCLAKDPNDRFASAAELRSALLACAAAGSWREEDARRWWAENAALVAGAPALGQHQHLSRTGVFVDFDSRASSTRSFGAG